MYGYDGLPINQIIVEIEIEIGIGIEIGIDPCPVWHLAIMARSSLTSGFGQHHNNWVTAPGFSCLNPIRYRYRPRLCFAIYLLGKPIATGTRYFRWPFLH